MVPALVVGAPALAEARPETPKAPPAKSKPFQSKPFQGSSGGGQSI